MIEGENPSSTLKRRAGSQRDIAWRRSQMRRKSLKDDDIESMEDDATLVNKILIGGAQCAHQSEEAMGRST